MARKKRRVGGGALEAFVDPLFGAFGAFLFLFLMVILVIGVSGTKPVIMTEELPVAIHGNQYDVWLSAEGGVGDYSWEVVPGSEIPDGLAFSDGGKTGRLTGIPVLKDVRKASRLFEFDVLVTALHMKSEDTGDSTNVRRFSMTLNRDQPIDPSTITPVKVMTPSPLPRGMEGKYYGLALAAEGGMPPYTWELSAPLPEGMEFDSDSGILKGIPAQPVEKYAAYATVKDSRNEATPGSSAKTLLSWTVLPAPPPPPPPPPTLTIHSKSFPEATEEEAYSLSLAGEGGKSPYRWNLVDGPEWMSLEATGGLLSCDPPLGSTGIHEFKVGLTDSEDRYTESILDLEIRKRTGAPIEKLELLTSRLPQVQIDESFSAPVAVRGGVYPLRFNADNLPPGVTLTPDGIVQGKLSSQTNLDIDVTVSDSHPDEAQIETARINLRTQPVPVGMEFTDQEYAGIGKATQFNRILGVRGGFPPYRFEAQSLPDGVEISRDGFITGNISEPGSYDVVVDVTDAEGRKGSANVSMEVVSPGAITIVSPAELPAVSTQSPYQLALAAEGGTGEYQWTLSKGKLPRGLTLKDGIIEGSLAEGTVAEERSFTVTASGGGAEKAVRTFKLAVTEDDEGIPLTKLVVLAGLIIGFMFAFSVVKDWAQRLKADAFRKALATVGGTIIIDPKTGETKIHIPPGKEPEFNESHDRLKAAAVTKGSFGMLLFFAIALGTIGAAYFLL